MAKRKTSSEGAAGSAKAPAGRAAKPKAGPVEKTEAVYQLKITLRDVRPPIWRRVQVKDCTLSELHEVIQVAMGWEFSHLYSFEVGGVQYGDLDMTGGELDMKDDRRAKLSRLVRGEKFKFHYTYDFGDNWEHEIVVEKILPLEAGKTYPACVDGKRAGPPEDVGGAWGYMDFVEAMRDPKHPRHDEFTEWFEDPFDPEAFDIDEVNRRLARRG
jgi:Plasmid pRiA4b ORF-3-like protein